MEEAASFEAATAVLETTEMLEHIMRFLDMKTLLLSQRVDRRWKATIKGSIMLQKKLFMRPATLEDVLELAVIESRQEDELLVLRDHWRTAATDKGSSWYSVVNPLLFDSVDVGRGQIFKHSPKWTAVDGSWRNMQIGQPPFSGFHFTNNKMGFRQKQFAMTMGQLQDAIGEALESEQGIVVLGNSQFASWALTRDRFMEMIWEEKEEEKEKHNEDEGARRQGQQETPFEAELRELERSIQRDYVRYVRNRDKKRKRKL